MAAPAVYRVPRRFITFPEDPRPYGLLAVSFLGHMLGIGGAVALTAFLGAQIDQSKVYIVNLVPASPSLGSPAADPPAAPVARAPAPPKAAPPAPKAEEKAPPKEARPEPPPPRATERTPERAPERIVEPPPPRAPEVAAARPKAIDPPELALPRRVEKDNPPLSPPSTRPIERSLPPPPPVSPAAPVAPTAPTRLPDPPRIATPPTAPAVPSAPPVAAAPPAPTTTARPSVDPIRPGRPNAPPVSGSNLSVDASDFPFTYYLRQLHAKVSERWRRPPLVASEQTSAVIYFEIDRGGQIRGEPKVKQTSGNELYDQSALRAVMESVPFPPLPPEFPGQYLKVNFGFDPGVNKG
jgi:TonB family protein